jgi:3-deoxy-D-manno-octulosonate 8-phosphate phosphatase (KDO 8-P phosphatase)
MDIWPELSKIHTIVFDFDGVFTDNKVYLNQDGIESVRCDRGDGLGIDFLRAYQRKGLLNAKIFILSKEKNPVVLSRAKKLKLDCVHGVQDKLAYMREYLRKLEADEESVFNGLVYLGNDLNDLPIIELAGFSVAPNDAHERVKALVDVVLPRNGGDGFVRAFVEKLLDFENLSHGEVYELVSNC